MIVSADAPFPNLPTISPTGDAIMYDLYKLADRVGMVGYVLTIGSIITISVGTACMLFS